MDNKDRVNLTDDILEVVSEFIHHFEYVDRKNMGIEEVEEENIDGCN